MRTHRGREDQNAGQGLHLVPRSPGRLSPLALWHLLSLDAPTVACVWTIFIARVAHVPLRWSSPAAMFVAVWMLYAADRLLDARPLAGDAQAPDLEERHRFHHRHRRGFVAVAVVAAVGLTGLLHTLPDATLHLYALLGTLLAGWLLLVHARLSEPRLPKELAVGVFFAAATFIPSIALHPELRLRLVPAAALLGVVCTLNCLFLYAWEHPRSRQMAHWTTRWATAHLTLLSLLALAAAALLLRLQPALAAACGLSVAALLLLNVLRFRIKSLHLRALADAALLTPLLLLPLLR